MLRLFVWTVLNLHPNTRMDISRETVRRSVSFRAYATHIINSEAENTCNSGTGEIDEVFLLDVLCVSAIRKMQCTLLFADAILPGAIYNSGVYIVPIVGCGFMLHIDLDITVIAPSTGVNGISGTGRIIGFIFGVFCDSIGKIDLCYFIPQICMRASISFFVSVNIFLDPYNTGNGFVALNIQSCRV